MKKERKYFVVILAILLVTIAVVGTVAWLTSKSSLTNTFTVGSFNIPTTSPLDSSKKINIAGNIYEPSWITTDEHKIVPSQSFKKDPYVGIGAGSEDAVVYVYVENNISNKLNFTINSGWEKVDGYVQSGSIDGTYSGGLFKYTAGLTASKTADTWTTTPLFNTINVAEDAQITDLTADDEDNYNVIVSAFLHQAKDGKGNYIDQTTILTAAKNAFKL